MNLTEAIEKNIFYIIRNSALEVKQNVYVIGGYVRDFLLNKKKSEDIDLVTTGSSIELAKKVSEKLNLKFEMIVFKNFGTVVLKYKNQEIQFVESRKESYIRDSRNPIVKKASIKEDQNRRDFSINAMAISLNSHNYGELIDPFNGLEDLNKKVLRTPINPLITYSDDPLRMLRAIRFASELNFFIEKESFHAIKKNFKRISIVSIERIMSEFQKIMNSLKPSVGLKLLYSTGLLSIILPELKSLKGVEEKEGYLHKDNFFHTLEVVDNISKMSNFLWLRWAALLHDIGKPISKKYIKNIGWTFYSHEFIGSKMIPSIFRRLKLPMGSILKYVQKIVKNSSRPIALISDIATDSALRRLIFDLDKDIKDLMLLCKADITTKNLYKYNNYYNNFLIVEKKLKKIEEKDKIRNWKSSFSGNDIMKMFNLKPSPKIGYIKNIIKESVLDGIVNNDYNSIYSFLLKEKKKFNIL